MAEGSPLFFPLSPFEKEFENDLFRRSLLDEVAIVDIMVMEVSVMMLCGIDY
jgi:hypothetical protein